MAPISRVLEPRRWHSSFLFPHGLQTLNCRRRARSTRRALVSPRRFRFHHCHRCVLLPRSSCLDVRDAPELVARVAVAVASPGATLPLLRRSWHVSVCVCVCVCVHSPVTCAPLLHNVSSVCPVSAVLVVSSLVQRVFPCRALLSPRLLSLSLFRVSMSGRGWRPGVCSDPAGTAGRSAHRRLSVFR